MWNNANQSRNSKLPPSASTNMNGKEWECHDENIGKTFLVTCDLYSNWHNFKQMSKHSVVISVYYKNAINWHENRALLELFGKKVIFLWDIEMNRILLIDWWEKGHKTQISWLNAFVGLIERHFSVDVWWIRLINLLLLEFYLAMTQIWKHFFEPFSFFGSFSLEIFSHSIHFYLKSIFQFQENLLMYKKSSTEYLSEIVDCFFLGFDWAIKIFVR